MTMYKKLECPNCETKMTFITFAKSPTPWHLKCSNCKAKLKINKYQIISTIIASIFTIIAVVIGMILELTFPLFILYVVIVAVIVEYIGFTLLKVLKVKLRLRV